MKVFVKEATQVWVNGKEYKVQAGMQDVDDNIALILIEAKLAEKVEEEDKKKR
jgi:hypothetical protein